MINQLFSNQKIHLNPHRLYYNLNQTASASIFSEQPNTEVNRKKF